MRLFFSLFLFIFLSIGTKAQTSPSYTWHNPLETVRILDGQGWADIGYHRFPDKAENLVRQAVWNLSKNAAGLSISFSSNSEKIRVEYEVSGGMGMHHMPATGVSGVDLYVKKGAEWLWSRGRFNFKDSQITYEFTVDNPNNGEANFKLFLPLYNTVSNLKVGVLEGSELRFLNPDKQKPIVVYGTSIAQGACASRPGMAWTNILSRILNTPIINLGFSGNGRLEAEVIELLAEIDPSIYILDCLPNLSPNEKRTKEEIQRRINNSVLRLREKRPNASILLVHHAGYSDGHVDKQRKVVYETLNSWMSEAFTALKSMGIKNLFLLSNDDIGLTNDAFVDGTHPTDLGMQQYANAYGKALLNITKENQ